MQAKYDARNMPALKTLLGQGAKLQRFPKEIMAAAFKSATDIYAELSDTNPAWKKIYDDYADDSGTGSANHFSLFGPSYGNRSHENEASGHTSKTPTDMHEIDKQNRELEFRRILHEKEIAHERERWNQQRDHEMENHQKSLEESRNHRSTANHAFSVAPYENRRLLPPTEQARPVPIPYTHNPQALVVHKAPHAYGWPQG
jgi:hypothetical protein